MKKLNEIKRGGDSRYIKIVDSEFGFFVMGSPAIKFNAKIDIVNMKYISGYDEETDEYTNSDLPTINDLIELGKVVEIDLAKSYDIEPKGFWGRNCNKKLTEKDVSDIIEEFKENGYNVSRRAILHNYSAWLGDLKSGYRGGKYHLFTPCGCNPLSFRATKLSKYCDDWQQTYEF